MMRGDFAGVRAQRAVGRGGRLLRALHLDGPLLLGLAAIIAFGLFVLYSATGGNTAAWLRQVLRVALAATAMVALAQVPPRLWRCAATSARARSAGSTSASSASSRPS